MKNDTLLTSSEERYVKTLSHSYYESVIKNESFETKKRQFGLEIEWSLTTPSRTFTFNSSEPMSKALSPYYVVPEFGSFQIEVNPPPRVLTTHSFQQLYAHLQRTRKHMQSYATQHDILLNPVGLPFFIDPQFYIKNQYITQKQRYMISSHYFKKYNNKGSTLLFMDGTSYSFPGNVSLSLINELHIHLQALNIHDLIHLFNYSQMITAPLVALGANSGITNGRQLINKEHQISLFEQAEGLYDGDFDLPRVGLFPGYLSSIDTYFKRILSFKPLYLPSNGSLNEAFELMVGKYFGWTRIRIGYPPNQHIRIEFRPLSTQPTIIENIALTEFYINTILALKQHDYPFLPEQFLRINLDQTIRHGMDADIFWDFGSGIQQYNVVDVLAEFLTLIDEGTYITIIKDRLQKKWSPSEKLIQETKTKGYPAAIQHYDECFQNDIPYTSV